MQRHILIFVKWNYFETRNYHQLHPRDTSQNVRFEKSYAQSIHKVKIFQVRSEKPGRRNERMASTTLQRYVFFFVDMELQKFNVIPTEKNYIQILHDSSLHWVCVANMESRKKGNEIHYLYNSLKKKHISKDVTHVTHPTHTILSRSW